MKIGIDLRALQTGHKFRGIGEVAKQTTDRIISLGAADKVHKIEFVFYEYDDAEDPKDLLTLPKELHYEVVKLGLMPEADTNTTTNQKLRRSFMSLYGQPIPEAKKVDVFLQFDYAFGVPKNTRTVLVKHDLIPYLFWDKYFESAWVPFKNKALRTTLRTLFANHRFMRTLKRSLKDAHAILAVSSSTKRDLERYFNVKPNKIKVTSLGVTVKAAKTSNELIRSKELPAKPYLLFVGAGDPRRRVEDAVAVYNNLKAEGKNIQLVLVGENFQSPETIPNPVLRNAVLKSSYASDILTLGYIDDDTKQELFRGALAYVYPTRYEGFGIPVLEAMLLECPVVTYKNSSLPEVGGTYAYYARNWAEMKLKIEEIMALPAEENRRRKHV